jgi:hypothetical protein
MREVPNVTPTEYQKPPETLSGYWWEESSVICIPFIESKQEGKGNLSRWLGTLESRGKIVFFPTVISARLDSILRKRGYEDAFIPYTELGYVDGLAKFPKGGTDGYSRQQASQRPP